MKMFEDSDPGYLLQELEAAAKALENQMKEQDKKEEQDKKGGRAQSEYMKPNYGINTSLQNFD